MKKNIKKIAIVGGSLAVLYYLISAYALGGKSGVKNILGIKQEPPKKVVKPKSVKPPKTDNPLPYIPKPSTRPSSGSSGGTGSVVTNNQTVPLNYNPRDYGDIVLGSVDIGGNIII